MSLFYPIPTPGGLAAAKRNGQYCIFGCNPSKHAIISERPTTRSERHPYLCSSNPCLPQLGRLNLFWPAAALPRGESLFFVARGSRLRLALAFTEARRGLGRSARKPMPQWIFTIGQARARRPWLIWPNGGSRLFNACPTTPTAASRRGKKLGLKASASSRKTLMDCFSAPALRTRTFSRFMEAFTACAAWIAATNGPCPAERTMVFPVRPAAPRKQSPPWFSSTSQPRYMQKCRPSARPPSDCPWTLLCRLEPLGKSFRPPQFFRLEEGPWASS